MCLDRGKFSACFLQIAVAVFDRNHSGRHSHEHNVPSINKTYRGILLQCNVHSIS